MKRYIDVLPGIQIEMPSCRLVFTYWTPEGKRKLKVLKTV